MPGRRYVGMPFSSRIEIRTSPTPSSVIAFSTSIFGFGRNVCRSDTDGLLLLRRVCPQGVLDAVAELRKHLIGNIRRILRHEINADALGTDQADDLLDLFDKSRRSIGKQKVSFVKKEDELRLVEVAGLGKRLE